MLSTNSYLGCPCNVDILVQHVDNLNIKVVEQLNNSQELVMLKNYVQETNERLFLNSLKERVSEVGSWHWVLQDLFKRMDDAILALKYESNAVNVVIRRLKDELKERTMEGCRPGALCPRTDSVEECIMQIRGARVQLSIGAQTVGARVDAVLRKRLHANTTKLEEMSFQREEALRDLRSLDEELASADKNIFETIEQEQIVIKRLEDRAKRPKGELTRDDVDRKLKAELASLRHFRKELRDNILRINRLQDQLKKAVARLDDYAHDVVEVMNLDQHRIQSRTEEDSQPLPKNSPTSSGSTRDSNLQRTSGEYSTNGIHQSDTVEREPSANVPSGLSPAVFSVSAPTNLNARMLDTIREEEEMEFDDDYPVNF